MTAALKFEKVSKDYRGSRRYRAFRDDLRLMAGRLVGRGGPPLEPVRALKEIDLDVPVGESFGLIGGNGAGKTTALKIAARITYPTRGRVSVRGRVGALIEVGTGMHPELTGRENIALYGRILGLRGTDIQRRFAEIVGFAGLEAAIDQPVKQYSSGMQLRLGFSVAAHLEPDVLLVDEALAVGDAGFQYRCIERMMALVKEGRTLIFVSHDMSAVETTCKRVVVLRDGKVAFDGGSRDAVLEYLRAVEHELLASSSDGSVLGRDLEIERVTIHDSAGGEVEQVPANQPMTVRLHYHARRPVAGPIFSVGLRDPLMGLFSLASMLVDGEAPAILEGRGVLDCTFASLPLKPRLYEVWGEVRGQSGSGFLIDWQRLRRFRVLGDPEGSGLGVMSHSLQHAPVTIPYRWRVQAAVGAARSPSPTRAGRAAS